MARGMEQPLRRIDGTAVQRGAVVRDPARRAPAKVRTIPASAGAVAEKSSATPKIHRATCQGWVTQALGSVTVMAKTMHEELSFVIRWC